MNPFLSLGLSYSPRKMKRLGQISVNIKQIMNKKLLYSTGNYAQYFVMTYKEKENEKEYIYIYMCIHTYISESLG